MLSKTLAVMRAAGSNVLTRPIEVHLGVNDELVIENDVRSLGIGALLIENIFSYTVNTRTCDF